MLLDIVPNPWGASTFSGVPISSRKALNSTFQTKAPNPFFFFKTMAIFYIKLVVMFHLVATLCEGGGTLKMAVTLKDPSKLIRFF
jgi:hypothetical protein